MAEAALEQLRLDEVRFVVANDPWQKTDGGHVSPAEVRLEMTRALTAGHPRMSVDDREVRRGGPTYTVDTLVELTAQDPTATFFLIVGADTASRIHTWHRHDEVVTLSTLVVVNRPAAEPAAIATAGPDRTQFVSMSPIDVSSTQIRTAVARGESIETMTTPGVGRIIAERGLYRGIR